MNDEPTAQGRCRGYSLQRGEADGSAIHARVSAGVCGRDAAHGGGVGSGRLARAIGGEGAAAVLVVSEELDPDPVQIVAAGNRHRAAALHLPFRGDHV